MITFLLVKQQLHEWFLWTICGIDILGSPAIKNIYIVKYSKFLFRCLINSNSKHVNETNLKDFVKFIR